MDKKEKLFNTLNNHFNSHNEFPEIYQIAEEDIEKIIALYEQEASKEGKDPWHYLYFDELIIMQKCVYEVIKDNTKYSKITDKIEILYQKELNRRLQRTVYSYGEPTDKTYTAPYTEMPEYSLVLADMCSRHMQETQKFVMDIEHMPLTEVESYLSTYESIKSDFAKSSKQMPNEQENIALQTKAMITLANEEQNAIAERERQQKEIELINLQQEINKMENEKLEIEKRLKTISSETLGVYFSKQISEKYPEEYQKFQQNKEQVKSYSSKATQISDLKERFNKAAEDLKFYQGMLPVYESYYQRFEEIKKQRQQQGTNENDQEKIYNLIHSAENERLKKSHSLYTAWDLGNKTIPPEYQGMTYEQVETLLNKKQVEEKVRQNTQATRDELIGKAIRKDLMLPENYHLSEVQIKNLSKQFMGYSNEELQEFITGGKKQKTALEVQQPFASEISSQPIQQQTIQEIQIPQVKNKPTSDYNEFEKNLISFIETRNSDLGKVSEILNVTGYPDSTYEVRFEDDTTHQITVTQDEKNFIKSRPPIQQSVQEQTSIENTKPKPSIPKVSDSEVSQTSVPNQQTEEKNRLINNIIGAMLNAGEFHNSGLDISQKMKDIEYAKKKLESKSMEELEWAISVYAQQQEEVKSTGGMHR
jgi:hypothetical protein